MDEPRKIDRKLERKTLISFTPVYDTRRNSLLGYLRDLTVQGAMLSGIKRMEPGQIVTLAVDFRETPEIPATRITLPTRVAWCRREPASTDYVTGVEFLELTDLNKMVILAILERYQFRPEPAQDQ
ncbi:MAG: PilZ domain-containing protein [Anaerolineales bacterium]